jgi:small subunit ribosomal protein S4
MEKKPTKSARPGMRPGFRTEEKTAEKGQEKPKKRMAKLSGYGKQLHEKQKVKRMYGMKEAQFRRFFSIAVRSEEATGDELLRLLECRLDNVLFRLKLSTTRAQARQSIVHGLVQVNGKKVHSPSYLVSVGDEISYKPAVLSKQVFLEQVVDKSLNTAGKVPEWVELDKENRKGRILRNPVRSDIKSPIEEHLIVELYSK